VEDDMTNKIGYDNVRRAAKHAGLIARKSRRGYMLLDARTRACVAGSWHDLSAEEALAWIDRLQGEREASSTVADRTARRAASVLAGT
jgi:hypothetical protein